MFVNDKKSQPETRNNIAFMKIKINNKYIYIYIYIYIFIYIFIFIIRKTSEILSEISLKTSKYFASDYFVSEIFTSEIFGN